MIKIFKLNKLFLKNIKLLNHLKISNHGVYFLHHLNRSWKDYFCLENDSNQKPFPLPIKISNTTKENMEHICITKETSFHYTKIVAGYNSQAAKIGLLEQILSKTRTDGEKTTEKPRLSWQTKWPSCHGRSPWIQSTATLNCTKQPPS